MIRYVCKSMDEVNYIINKFNFNTDYLLLNSIHRSIKVYGSVTIGQDEDINYCTDVCTKCLHTTCDSKNAKLIDATNIMREEKLKNILYE